MKYLVKTPFVFNTAAIRLYQLNL